MAGVDNCIQKVNRANAHIACLEEAVKTFLAKNPYPVELQPKAYHSVEALDSIGVKPPDNLRKGHTWIKNADVSLGIEKEPDPIGWGLLIGDAVNNLRGALDHLVWGLADTHSGPPPPEPIPRGSPWRDVSFPIVLKEADWHSGLKKLSLVDPRLHARFKRLQPFARRKKTPERDALVVLERLWNIDKHRYIPVVVTYARFERHLGGMPQDWPTAPLHIEVRNRRRIGPLKPHTKLATLHCPIDGPGLVNVEALQRYVDMKLAFTFDIAFEKGWPAYGARVIKTLRQIQDRVTAILVKFESALN